MGTRFRDIVTGRALRTAARRKFVRAVETAIERHHRQQQADFRRIADELRDEITGQVDRAVERAIDRVIEFEVRSRKDIIFAGDQVAAAESNRFAIEHLTAARQFGGPRETLEYAVGLAPTGGMALEFGVASGETLALIAGKRDDGKVFGFDSFQGLPEDWLPGVAAGAFARDNLPAVPGAELVVGLFEETLPGFLETHQDPVDFVHVDCDLYSSARTVLEHVVPRMKPGAVIVFDEFFNYPGWQRHEYRAWTEYVERTGIAFDYEAFTYRDSQVAVRLALRTRSEPVPSDSCKPPARPSS